MAHVHFSDGGIRGAILLLKINVGVVRVEVFGQARFSAIAREVSDRLYYWTLVIA